LLHITKGALTILFLALLEAMKLPATKQQILIMKELIKEEELSKLLKKLTAVNGNLR